MTTYSIIFYNAIHESRREEEKEKEKIDNLSHTTILPPTRIVEK